ncbi:Gamma-intimin [Providencia rettgeri]|uniref:Gamma-intimin n=1 Tax=Providencia rettgeri TaxID=587 RepID=A0A379FTT6_PRORE|nr:Gamma-intimin [Providencia rettgeri]
MSSQVSSLPYYSKTRRLTAYILLVIQLFLPISVAFSAVVQAAEQESLDMMSTMSGIQALMEGNEGATPESTTSPNSSDKKSSKTALGALGVPNFTVRDPNDFSAPPLHDNTVRQDDILSALPTLGLAETEDENKASPETQVAQGASQAGQLLSNGDAVDASIGYARSLGENLINQQITDWLNQYGKARVQLGTDKTGDADLLLPLIDKANSLVFSQVGIRANEDRNTTNLGLGYRQYQADWMWGVNSFYDYDITGGNSRVGVGSELWFDYLKFAGNGYFRLTDWHQSDLHAMRDYDERPANGFDLRAEGYLPSYPQLGAYAKYEQYFGKGISLSDSGVSASDLKDDPSRSTLGVSYTPFPLMTLKGETSRGDSNDSRLGLELTYRFGVPLNQQLDPEYVDLMRNLAGNRYDFVDRNYNIVMQYRKQELLTISLPDSMTAEAAALLPVTATVNKSKYGLKSIAWSAPELIAQGGQIQVTSPTTINLTLPAYVFQTRANEPQSYRVSAVGTDNEGNTSNTAVMWVNVKPSQETVASLTLSPNTVLLANNSDTYTATALIQNEKGEALVDKDVTFTVSGFTDNEKVTLTGGNGESGQSVTVRTDSQGQALITIKSKIAGDGVLKATMKNGNFRNATLRFAADASTAQITELVLTDDKAVANGKATNVAVATVKDQFGNVVEGFDLESSASNGAVVVTPSQVTNTQGQVTTSFTNMAAGSSVLTVKGNSTGTQKTVTAQFIADISTAKIASVVVDKDNAVANGQDRNTVTVTVVDGNGNVLANAPVTITVPGAAKYSTQPANGLTNSQGQLVINYTNTKAGTENYSVSINNSQEMAVLTFKADSANPSVSQSKLTVSPKTIKADGAETANITLILKDKFGNTISGQTVAFSTTLANTTISATQDNGQGDYLSTISGTQIGDAPISVLVNGKTLAVNSDSVTLVATSPVQATSSISVDKASYVAGGEILVTVTLKDVNGNIVVGQSPLLTSSAVSVANAEVKSGTRWIDNNNGSYSRAYLANTAGTGLLATLQLSDWSGDTVSSPYAITSGSAVALNSTIAVDKATYASGDEINVTVMLKDAQGNLVNGQAELLTSTTVKVPNSSLKTGANWIDNGDGTYTTTYVAEKAGSKLNATLQLTGWSSAKTSSPYAITAGDAVPLTSSITVDKSSYTAGSDIVVTVGLKDKQGNAVNGQASALSPTTVTVPNATPKANSSWVDNGNGTYTGTYVANTTGTNLKAQVQLSGWSSTVSSSVYTITAGNAVQVNSSVTVDNNTYTAGSDITVTVTLKDAEGNAVSGQASALTQDTVTVPNATPKASGNWVDNGDGTYTKTYVANTAGSNLQAEVKLSGWTGNVTSGAYAITAGNADQTRSAITVDKTTYVAGTDITVTVTLKDAQGNVVNGQASALSPTTVTVPNATQKANSSWVDNGNGTYTGIYIANTVGTGLKASAQLSAWGSAISSAAYAITSGSADQANSSVTVDNTTYTAGGDITVTVTLKDAQGNAVSGQASALTGTVTVPNATPKASSNWVDNGDGTYTKTYVANTVGANLHAEVKLTDWTENVTSGAYAITAGNADQANSSVMVDNTTYVAGTDITVTVTLKDAQGNVVNGQASALSPTTVTVPNATQKASSRWVDNGNGTYTGTYVANTTGTGLKASVKLTDWTNSVESAGYAITVGKAAQSTSTVAVDNTTYVAGTDITVTVTLKDAEGNLVSGQASALTSSTVTVPNATQKASGRWVDNGDGTYTGTYVANTTGTGLKAEVKLTDWTGGVTSAAYAITVGNVVEATSTITVDNTTYVAGSDIIVTVTLKDAEGNAVSGQASALTSSTVTVPNATQKANSNWVDNGDGTYTGTYVANTTGTGLKAEVKLTDWTGGVTSGAYAITVGNVVEATSTITVDNTTYVAGSDIIVTVALKDAEGNAVSGQASALTSSTVTVPNATQKASSRWVDNGDGTYTATYVANTVGTGLKASTKLSGWASSVMSGMYAITVGEAAQSTSAVVVDNTTYVAGTDITVTVTLKDAEGNLVGGQASALTDTVTVPNATQKANSNWVDNGDGTYTGTYVANTVGTGLKASVKLTDWTSAVESAGYAITVGKAAQSTSTVVVDNTTYVAGTDITVTVTLKDAEGNAVSGQASALTDTVTVPNATQKANSNWVDNGDGTYTGTYVANTVGTGLKASVKLTDWANPVESAGYTITVGDVAQSTSSLSINKSRIIANNGQNEGVATVTLIAKDGQNNPVDGLKDDLQFVVLKENTVVTNGVFIKNMSATATHGQYTADVSGIDAGNYVIKVKIGDEYFGALNTGITLYSYNFYINENVINREVIPGQIVNFIVNATPTDNSTIELTIDNVIWSSSNNNVGVLSGDSFIAKNTGKTIITGSNINLNGITGNNLSTNLTVLAPNNSEIIGSQSGNKVNDLISPPDYKLYTQSANIVDGIGSNLTEGGYKQEITNLNNISRIDTWYVRMGNLEV